VEESDPFARFALFSSSSPGEQRCASFTITPAPARPITGVQPLLYQDSARLLTPSIALDPADPQRIAYCAPGGIQLSTDGGTSWSQIPTLGVTEVASTTAYPVFTGGSSQPPSCHSVTLDPDHPQSFYTVFETAQEPYGEPPIFLMGYFTTDAGKNWQLVVPPPDYTIAQFGGFRATPDVVQVLFAGQPSSPKQTPLFSVEQTIEGGHTWAPADLICPASAPCIRWGPAPSQIGGMGVDYPQALLISHDGGKTWKTPAWPTQVILNSGPSQLVTLSDSNLVLISPGDDYPFRVSHDGGQTWKVTSLPSLIGGDGNVPLYPALQMLPNGALLVQSQTSSSWQILVPGAQEWCTFSALLPTTPELLVAIEDQLWWLEVSGTPNPAPMPKHVLVSDLKCGP
jgi:hypothetical protein